MMTNKIKVMMIHRIFASYRKPIYDRLAERFDYTLLHGDNDKTINQSVAEYSKPIRFFQYSKNETHILFQSFTHFFRLRPQVVIHEFAVGILTLLPMYFLSKLSGAKFILYSHGYNRLTGFHPNKSWSDKYRLILMRLADATVIYTHSDKKRLAAFTNPDKIFVAQNTLDTVQLRGVKQQLNDKGKAAVKTEMGFTHRYNLTFIGRILDEKMPDAVLDVFEFLNKKMPNEIGIHFVGGGNIEPLIKKVKDRGWEQCVIFHGAEYDEYRSGAYLFASDLMIMPGYLGLAVNHAFAFDCPVVSFLQTKTGPFHSPEIEYVINGETGFLIPDLSVEKMAETIINYLNNNDLQIKMKNNIQRKMQELTPENMVKGFTDAVEYVVQKSKLSNF